MTDNSIGDQQCGQEQGGPPAPHGVVVMVAKSSASAIFKPGEHVVMNFEGAPGTFAVKFWTDYGGKFDIPVPLKRC